MEEREAIKTVAAYNASTLCADNTPNGSGWRGANLLRNGLPFKSIFKSKTKTK